MLFVILFISSEKDNEMEETTQSRPSQVDDGFESLNGNGSSDNNDEDVTSRANREGLGASMVEGVQAMGKGSHKNKISFPLLSWPSHLLKGLPLERK